MTYKYFIFQRPDGTYGHFGGQSMTRDTVKVIHPNARPTLALEFSDEVYEKNKELIGGFVERLSNPGTRDESLEELLETLECAVKK